MNFLNKQDKSTTNIIGNSDYKVDPIFILMLDSVAQLTKANPQAFEFTSSYLAFIASEVYTNRFFEFIQSDSVDDSQLNLPSVFGPEFREGHKNLIFKPDYKD